MKKTLIKSAILAISFVLASCAVSTVNNNNNNDTSSQTNVSNNGTSSQTNVPNNGGGNNSTNETQPKDNTSSSITSDNTLGNNNESSSNTQSSNNDEDEAINQLETDIETKYINKLNSRFGEERVESLDLRYFALNNSSAVKELEVYGYVKLYDGEANESVLLSLPLGNLQFYELQELFSESYDFAKTISKNYSVEWLNYISDFLNNEELDFDAAFKNGDVWNLDDVSVTKMVKLINEQIARQINQIYIDYYNNNDAHYDINLHYFTLTEEKYVDNGIHSLFVINLSGEAKILETYLIRDEYPLYTKDFELRIQITEGLYNLLSDDYKDNYDSSCSLIDNYDDNVINNLYTVILDERCNPTFIIIDYYVMEAKEERIGGLYRNLLSRKYDDIYLSSEELQNKTEKITIENNIELIVKNKLCSIYSQYSSYTLDLKYFDNEYYSDILVFRGYLISSDGNQRKELYMRLEGYDSNLPDGTEYNLSKDLYNRYTKSKLMEIYNSLLNKSHPVSVITIDGDNLYHTHY